MNKITITEPILKAEYKDALRLVEENLLERDLTLEELENGSAGELLIAKNGKKVVGMLSMRHPGKIFREIEDKYFYLKDVRSPKESIGYIALVSVDKNAQKQGIGKALVTKAIEIQKEWGAEAIIAHASQNSPEHASEKMFAACGFTPTHLHKQPWHDYSLEKGPEGFQCHFCGNPCTCDELEMILYL